MNVISKKNIETNQNRIIMIDVLKGISIIAVVLYHIFGDKFSTGYLGVDVFFVINGFLVIPSLFSKIYNKEFKYLSWLIQKIVRFFPLLVVVCVVSLALGLLFLFPDNLLTLSESIIASLFFSNNLLSLFLCSDYWDWTNEFKPLMHTWYLAVLMEMYVVIPIIMIFVNRVLIRDGDSEKSAKKKMTYILVAVAIMSLFLFLKNKKSELNFYIFVFRLYESIFGGILGLYIVRIKRFLQEKHFNYRYLRIIKYLSVTACVLLLFMGIYIGKIDNTLFANKTYIPIVVIVTLFCISTAVDDSEGKTNIAFKLLTIIGKVSYPIFLWHQVLLAYYRCYISTSIDLKFGILFVFLLGILVYLSYLFEVKARISSIKEFIPWGMVAVILCVVCFIIWIRAGVIHDIPELDVYSENIERRVNPQYCDRIYSYDKQFDLDDAKIKVLVIGNSFGRDFANILLESDYARQIDLTYSFSIPQEEDRRVEEAEYIFIMGFKDKISSSFFSRVNSKTKVYGIGTKNFGTAMEQIYVHRKSNGYFMMTAKIIDEINEQDKVLQSQWGEDYINIMSLLKTDYNHIRVFSDDNKFISYDGHHLAKAGAKYLARIIDFNNIFNSK